MRAYVPAATGFAGSRYWFFLTRSSFKRFLTPLHLTTLLYVLTLAVLDPTSHVNLIRVLFVLFQAVPSLVQLIACCVYYGKAPARLASRALRLIMLKHYYGLEAFLSFNARPVVTERVREALLPGPLGASATGGGHRVLFPSIMELIAELGSERLRNATATSGVGTPLPPRNVQPIARTIALSAIEVR